MIKNLFDNIDDPKVLTDIANQIFEWEKTRISKNSSWCFKSSS